MPDNSTAISFPMICLCLAVLFMASLIGWGIPRHSASAATEPDFAKIDRYIQQQMQKERIPGVSLAITAQPGISSGLALIISESAMI